MTRHIHELDGKFNIWSTMTDEYLLDHWCEEAELIQILADEAAERARKLAQKEIALAKQNGCSVTWPEWRCKRETIGHEPPSRVYVEDVQVDGP